MDIAVAAHLLATPKPAADVAALVFKAATNVKNTPVGAQIAKLAPVGAPLRTGALDLQAINEYILTTLDKVRKEEVESLCKLADPIDTKCNVPWIKFCLTVEPLFSYKCNIRAPVPDASSEAVEIKL